MKILFRAPNWVGDAVISTAILKELLDKYENVYIGLMNYVEPIFEGFKKEMIFLTKDPIENGKLLKGYRFDKAFLFSPSFSSSLEAYLGCVRERIGFPKDLRHLLLTKKVRSDKVHLLNQYRDIVEGYVDLKYYKPEIPNVKRRKTNGKKAGIDMKSAFGEAKSWKKEGFIEIARFLEEKGYKILQFGKDPDESLTSNIENLTGRTTLKEAIEIISELDLFISVDTGSMHIAASFGIPQVAFFLSSLPEWTAPFYNEKLVVIRSDARCSPCFNRKCRFGDYHCREIDINSVKKRIGELVEKSSYF